ncbi:MAG: T9SS type A sorting domain-containing protein [Candidatus Marinimicrobia bacterium]|nr:T9SS type A sorting domain-containing protein [Candidatus Neomarinimicrobiota bacterium]
MGKNISRGKFIYYGAVGTLAATIPSRLIAQVCDLTTADIAGPFYEPGSPIRTQIAHPDEPGTRLFMSGQVKGIDCQPLQNAMVEVWQADDDGCYSIFNICDNGAIEDEFKLRGTIMTNAEGYYGYETILPANYANRPRHIHYKITAPDGTSLITQLYFENDPLCETDPWCSGAEDRIVLLSEEGEILSGQFDITLDTDMVTIISGDVNQDGQLNVLDIVSTVAHILGNEQFTESQLYAADMNGDGFINVLDIVQMVNGILLLPRTNTMPVINSKIEIGNGNLKLTTDGEVAGIQLDVSGDFKLTNIPHNWDLHHNDKTILLFSIDGTPLNSDILFEYEGELNIESNLISDWHVHRSVAEVVWLTSKFNIGNAYPNPFNPQTKIDYHLEASAEIEIFITDILGRKIKTIYSGQKSSGSHSFSWDASIRSSGVYFAHLKVGNQSITRKLLLVK